MFIHIDLRSVNKNEYNHDFVTINNCLVLNQITNPFIRDVFTRLNFSDN